MARDEEVEKNCDLPEPSIQEIYDQFLDQFASFCIVPTMSACRPLGFAFYLTLGQYINEQQRAKASNIFLNTLCPEKTRHIIIWPTTTEKAQRD